MQRTKTWKRLAGVGLTTAVMMGLAPVAAFATSPLTGTGQINLVSPVEGTLLTGNNGGDNLQHLSAQIEQAAPLDPQIAFVQFSYVDNTNPGGGNIGGQVAVTAKSAGADNGGGDAFATQTWLLPGALAGDSLDVTATAYEANHTTVVDSETNTVTDTAGLTVGITLNRPQANSLVGYNPHTQRLNVTGTTGLNGQGVTANTFTTGNLPATANVAGIYNQGTNNWAADLAINGADVPSGSGTKSLAAVNAFTSFGEEATPGTVYNQTYAAAPGGFTMTPMAGFGCQNSANPTGPCANPALTTPNRIYVIQATDQHGNPISGLPVDLTFTDPGGVANSFEADIRSVSGPTTWTNVAAVSGTPVPAQTGYSNPVDVGQLATDVFGQITFRVSNTDAEVIGIEAKSKFTDTFVSGTDYDLHGSYSTVVQVPASGTVTAEGHPTFSIYATQSYGHFSGGAGAGPSPDLEVNVKDGSGNPIQGATVNYSFVRTITGGQNVSGCVDPNVYPLTVPTDPSSVGLGSTDVSGAGGVSDASGNLFIEPDSIHNRPVVHAAYVQDANIRCAQTESGTDAFTVYIDKNGVPGYQSGADTLIGTPTLAFGPESLYFQPCDQVSSYATGNDPFADAFYQSCNNQQIAGSDLPLTVFASIWNGTTRVPITSRKIDIDIPAADATHHMVFSTTNPGLVLVDPHQGSITTDANGLATVNVVDTKASDDQSPAGPDSTNNLTGEIVTATDPTLGNATGGSETARDHIDWRNYQTVLNTVAPATARYVGEVTPLAANNKLVGSPGQPLLEGFQLLDQNGNPLSDQKITINLNNAGSAFITDLPSVSGLGGDANSLFPKLHFDTAPANNAAVLGDVHSDGTTQTVVTSHDGNVYFALGIKKDSGFDNDGLVNGDVTAQLGTSGSTLTLPDNDGNTNAQNHVAHQVLFSTDNHASYDGGHVAALNPGAITLTGGSFDNNGRYHVGSAAPSGNKATSTVNTIPVDTVDSTAVQTDSFGNRVSEPITVTTSGAAAPNSGTFWGSYTGVDNSTAATLGFAVAAACAANPAAISAGACQEYAGGGDLYVNQLTNPASNVPVTGSETVTGTWTANHSTWLVDAGTHAISVNVLLTPVLTVSYTITWYDREPGSFTYKLTATPGGNTHKVQSPVTYTVTVVDGESRSVNGLGVEFIQSGPSGQVKDTGNPWTCVGSCTNVQFTNVQGNAGFTFVSSTPGKYTVTAVITDGSGNEVGRTSKTGRYVNAGVGSQHPGIRLTSTKGHVTIHVTSHPTVKGITVHFFVKRNGAWHRIGSTKTGAKGHASLTRHEPSGKHRTFRAQVVGSPAAHAGYSAAKRITVK